MPAPERSRTDSVRSVDRALSILQVIARHGEITMAEIAVEIGVHKSTAFRLLATLEARGMVERGPNRGCYRVGYGVVQLAAGATRGHDLSVLSRPICQRLADELGETVNIAIHDGTAVISIDQIIGTSAVTTVNWVGQRTPIHATAAGKVFLAYGARLPRRPERFTEHTITRIADLRIELEGVRERGYAASVEEHEAGLVAVAAPIRDIEDSVAAAVVASGPTFRFPNEQIPQIAEQVMAAASEISQRNGAPKPG